VDIERKCIELPWNHYKRPGENYQIGGLMNIGFLDAGGLQSYCMAYFTRICGMTQEQVERMCGMIRREINSPGIAVFSHLYVSNMTRIKTLTNMPQVLMEGSKTFSGRSAWRKSTTTHEG